LAIVQAAGNITEMAADNISTVTGTTAMTVLVRQSENLLMAAASKCTDYLVTTTHQSPE